MAPQKPRAQRCASIMAKNSAALLKPMRSSQSLDSGTG